MKISKMPSRKYLVNVSLIIFLAPLLASCGGGGASGSTPPPPLVQAMILGFPSGAAPANLPTAMVSVTDGSTGAAITDAVVMVNGTALTYNGAPTHAEYEGTVTVNPGATVTLVVQTGGKTYSATNTQITTYPAISTPVSGDTWLTGNANTVAWTAGVPPPLTSPFYNLIIANDADPVGVTPYFQSVPANATTLTIPGWALALVGKHDVVIGLSTVALVTNADPASYLEVGGYSFVPVTMTPLPIPPNFQATSGDGQVTLSWSPLTSAGSYNIYWSTTAANANKISGTKITGITNPYYVHTGLTNATPYYYTVTEVSGNTESAESQVVSAAPGAPMNVSAIPGNTQATISWGAVTGATSYNIYWSTTDTNATKLAGNKITGVSTPFAHTGLNNGTSYYYVVTGVSAAGESSETAVAKVVPGSMILGGGIQGYPLALTNTVTTVATANSFGLPWGIFYPVGITSDGSNLYVADGNVKKIVISTGMTTVIAGGIPGTCGSTDAIGTLASFCGATGVATDGNNLYITDVGNRTIRKMVIATGEVTTFAGQTGVSGSANGTGTAATFNYIQGITTDGTNLYVTDSMNNNVRKIVIATAAVTTLAAGGFAAPTGITTDGTSLYVTDMNNETIKQIAIATGAVTTLAGTTGVGGSADGVGTNASFACPMGITTDGTNLYVADTCNNTIRKIVIATGVVTTLAGAAGVNGQLVDGTGSNAKFYNPKGITTDGVNLFVSDNINAAVRKIR